LPQEITLQLLRSLKSKLWQADDIQNHLYG